MGFCFTRKVENETAPGLDCGSVVETICMTNFNALNN